MPAQRPEDPGVLVLSELAGAARELQAALIVNPYDIDDVADGLAKALDMPLEQRQQRWGVDDEDPEKERHPPMAPAVPGGARPASRHNDRRSSTRQSSASSTLRRPFGRARSACRRHRPSRPEDRTVSFARSSRPHRLSCRRAAFAGAFRRIPGMAKVKKDVKHIHRTVTRKTHPEPTMVTALANRPWRPEPMNGQTE